MDVCRILPIESAYNFRDLGGYIGEGGKSVKWRRLIRSGDFATLSEGDMSYLADIPLLSVVDFRSEKEIEQLQDRLPQSVRNTHRLSINAGNLVPRFKQLVEDSISHSEEVYQDAVKMMEDLYKELVTKYSGAYKSFFRILQEGEQPLLFHCTAGKDRTGVAAALVLSVLGVDRSVIYEDYLLTNNALQGKYDHLNKYGPIASLFKSVRTEFLESAFNEIDKQYGNIESYLTKELDVNLKHLRELYLEK